MQAKIINSFKKLSKLKRRDILDKDGNVKEIPENIAISFARLISTGFDDIDLRKKPTKRQYNRARKRIKEFYQATRSEKVKIIRPQKKNRKYYAEFSAMPQTFKVFAVPAITDKDEFKVIGKGKNKKLQRVSEFSETEFFKFKSRKKLVTDTKGETQEIFSRIKKKTGEKVFSVKIKCGRGEHKVTLNSKNQLDIEISNLINAYGEENVKQWALGLNVYTFKNQKPVPSNKLKRKKKSLK